jgi:MFS family permease
MAGATMALFFPKIVRRIGNRNVVVAGMAGTALAAVIVARAPGLTVTLLAAAVNGFSWTAAGTGSFGFFSESTPQENMTRYTTAYTRMLFLAMFIGPLIGSNLARMEVDLASVLLVGAGLRLLAGVSIYLKTGAKAFASRSAEGARLVRKFVAQWTLDEARHLAAFEYGQC